MKLRLQITGTRSTIIPDKATYTFRITVPKPYVVAVSGLLQEEVDNGDTVTYVWEAAEPMASHATAVSVAEYVIEAKQGPDGVSVTKGKK